MRSKDERLHQGGLPSKRRRGMDLTRRLKSTILAAAMSVTGLLLISVPANACSLYTCIWGPSTDPDCYTMKVDREGNDPVVSRTELLLQNDGKCGPVDER